MNIGKNLKSECMQIRAEVTREGRRPGSSAPDETANRVGWGPGFVVRDKPIRGISLTRQGLATHERK